MCSEYISNLWWKLVFANFTSLKSRIALQVARKIAPCVRALRSADKYIKAHCLPREYTLKRSLPWCILAERNNSIITCKCQRVFVHALDQNLTTWKSKADACAYHVNLFFVDPPSSPPKRHPPRPTEWQRSRFSKIYTSRRWQACLQALSRIVCCLAGAWQQLIN